MKTSSHENLNLLHEVADSSFGECHRMHYNLSLRSLSLSLSLSPSLIATIILVFVVGSAFALSW